MKVYSFVGDEAWAVRLRSTLTSKGFEYIEALEQGTVFTILDRTEYYQRICVVGSRSPVLADLLKVAVKQRDKHDLMYLMVILEDEAAASIPPADIATCDEYIFYHCSDMELVMRFERARHELMALQSRQKQLTHDPVSGALNQQPLYDKFDEQFDLAKRESQPLTLIAFSVEPGTLGLEPAKNFDKNKLAADAINVAHSKLRKYDIIGRVDNGDFLLILPNCGARPASAIANRIKRDLKFALRCESNLAVAVWTPGQLIAQEMIVPETLNKLNMAKLKGNDNIQYVDWWI